MNEQGSTTEPVSAPPVRENGAAVPTEMPGDAPPVPSPLMSDGYPGLGVEGSPPAVEPALPETLSPPPEAPGPSAGEEQPALGLGPSVETSEPAIHEAPPAKPAAAVVEAPAPVVTQSADQVKMMEERLRRLEDVLASLNERRPDPPVAPLAVAVAVPEPPKESIRDKANRLADAGKVILPLATGLLRSPDPTSPTALAASVLTRPAGKPPWLLVEVYSDLRTIVRMFLDRARFQVSWVGWVVPSVALFIIISDKFFLEGMPFLGYFFTRAWFITSPLVMIIDLLAAFVTYKALLREAARYKETVGSQ